MVQTPFPTLQKDPMNEKEKKEKKFIAKRWESSKEEAESEVKYFKWTYQRYENRIWAFKQ